jgi:hypothetical protein
MGKRNGDTLDGLYDTAALVVALAALFDTRAVFDARAVLVKLTLVAALVGLLEEAAFEALAALDVAVVARTCLLILNLSTPSII